ncbi:hypothetical protein [Arcobacter sp.]|uniref:hypothetical protein n=1 Tax=Arcobacter sp. TaxID=1872629 RepID=UPI003B00B21A
MSALIAAFALAISLWNYWEDAEQSKIEKWQEVAVYEFILNNKLSTFQDIKVGYITEAQQITTFSLPKNEIQDDALRKIILKLQSNNLIRLRDTGYYEAVLATYQPNPTEMMDIIKRQQHLRDLFPIVKTKVIDLLNKDCGKLNQDEIYRYISDSVDIEAPIFIDMLHSMRGIEVHMLKDETWCTTYDSEKIEK